MLQRTLPAGFIAPCLPIKIDKLPSGSEWLHEIKHDGFRIIARNRGAQVRDSLVGAAEHGMLSSHGRAIPSI
jgi:bifunctional non-homologous end joining protein LigD